MKVLLLGAGVNSTALLVLKAQGKVDFDLAIFADTGGENPKTYRYIEEVIKPYCDQHRIKLVMVRKEGLTLYEHHWNDKLIPLRMYRSCTDKFKKRVIKQYLLRNYGKETIIQLIGFCRGEEKRAANNECNAISPLIEMGIDREGCKKIIQDASLPIPIKSGCFFCPHQPMKSWLNLLKDDPELYAKAEELEKHGTNYPKLFLPYDYSLESLRKLVEAMKGDPKKEQKQKALFSYMPKTDTCPMCEIENNEVLA